MVNKSIEEYKNLTKICAKTDYSDESSVAKHNKSVDRMYEIVDSIKEEKNDNTIEQFYQLLELTENKTNLWAAFHLLERLPTTPEIEHKAISIIESFAKGDDENALGCKYWLKQWNKKKGANKS